MILASAFTTTPISHRGLHDINDGRPENSTEAVAAAISHGYAIEIDLQLSSDGVPMVFHDYHLGRLTHEEGPVALRTAAELGQIMLKGGGSGIPTFEQVLNQIGGRVPLLVEIKDQDGAMGPNVGVLERSVAADLRGYQGPVAVMSFNPHTVTAFGVAAPDVPRGLVTSAYKHATWSPLPPAVCDHLRGIPDYASSGASFISHEAADLDRPRVAALKKDGATVLCWTIKSPEAEAKARKIADNITFEKYLA